MLLNNSFKQKGIKKIISSFGSYINANTLIIFIINDYLRKKENKNEKKKLTTEELKALWDNIVAKQNQLNYNWNGFPKITTKIKEDNNELREILNMKIKRLEHKKLINGNMFPA